MQPRKFSSLSLESMEKKAALNISLGGSRFLRTGTKSQSTMALWS